MMRLPLRLTGPCLALAVFSSTSALAAVELPPININGFATVAGVATNNNDSTYLGAGKDISFDTDSMAGVQFTLQANDRVNYTLQLVTRAEKNYEVEAEWAFAAFKLNEYAEVRAGRLRIPFYLISDSLEVGYSYPWVRPPIDAYAQFAFSKFSGVDAVFTLPVGDSEFVFHPHFGTSASDLELMGMQGSFNVTNLAGLNITWSYDWINLRLGHTEGDYEVNDFSALDPLAGIMRGVSGSSKVEDQFAIKGRHGQFSGIGLDMDKNNVKVMAEYAERKTNGLMSDTASWYVMAGYHFGKWMPHITISEFKTDTDYTNAKAAIPLLPDPDPLTLVNELQMAVGQIVQFNTVNQKSVTLGLRGDILPKTALKLEWQRLMPEKASNLLSPPFEGADTFFGAAGPGNLDDVDLFSIALDFIF